MNNDFFFHRGSTPSPATNQQTHLQPFPFLFVAITTLITFDEEEKINKERQIWR
jgi:hypothetical protein